jgi:hypothetical protein
MKKLILLSLITAGMVLLTGGFSTSTHAQSPANDLKPTFISPTPGLYVNGWPAFTVSYPKEWEEVPPMPGDLYRAGGTRPDLPPYDEADAPFFFGREAEAEIISANLMASRLTLLYGPSGVGKSSVLRAGVVRHLRLLAGQNLIERGAPEFAVIVFSAWRDNPITALAAQIERGAEGSRAPSPRPSPQRGEGRWLLMEPA